jgi:hypothetical protein
MRWSKPDTEYYVQPLKVVIYRGLRLGGLDGMLDLYNIPFDLTWTFHWYRLQAVNFLNKMAFEVELDAPGNLNGSVKIDLDGDTRFKPMNRKWGP